MLQLKRMYPVNVKKLIKKHLNPLKNENVYFLKTLILEIFPVLVQELLKKILKCHSNLFLQIQTLSKIYSFLNFFLSKHICLKKNFYTLTIHTIYKLL